jgi:hypothetical protein
MRREIEQLYGPKTLDQCCPGHDEFPNDTYRNRRSKRARARDKAVEHRFVRRARKRELRREFEIY